MNWICLWLVGQFVKALPPNDRETVQGDLAEQNVSSGRALYEVLGLLVRRQAALWLDWRPWLALLGVAAITGMLLREVAFQVNDALGHQAFSYSRLGLHFNLELTLGQDILYMTSLCLALLSWSWTCGFVLGSLSGRTIWLTGTLFYLFVLESGAARVLFSALHSGFFQHRLSSFILSLFLSALLSANMATLLLCVLPAFVGMRHGLRSHILEVRQAWLAAATIVILTSVVTLIGGWLVPGEGVGRGISWPTRLLPLALLSWPSAYVVVTAYSKRSSAPAMN